VNQNQEITRIDGTVTEALPNTMFRVELTDGRNILTSLKGTLRRRYVRIFPGDNVTVEMTKYDEERGRIVNKYRK
jgi:translation initiation factor IF-1